jgi:hypothetical protein
MKSRPRRNKCCFATRAALDVHTSVRCSERRDDPSSAAEYARAFLPSYAHSLHCTIEADETRGRRRLHDVPNPHAGISEGVGEHIHLDLCASRLTPTRRVIERGSRGHIDRNIRTWHARIAWLPRPQLAPILSRSALTRYT